jgi:serine/threonine protein kinase
MSEITNRSADRPPRTLEYLPAGSQKELESATLTFPSSIGDGPAVSLASDKEAASRAGYEILGELGRGGMGVVYKARQIGLNRLVALKMILAGGHAGPQELARFRAEAEAVARIQQPNIVQVYEVGEIDGRPFFSLEFVEGGSLADKLDGTPLPARSAAQLVETLARAVEAAHQQGIIHRDLKPGNVLLGGVRGEEGGVRGQGSGVRDDVVDVRKDAELVQHRRTAAPWPLTAVPKIADFGLAKRLDAAGQTQTGAIVGTPSYMAPEQAGAKGHSMGPATDVYALGAILYELLTGRPPFRAPTPLDTVLEVLNEEPVPPSRLQPKLPRDLETICLKCLQKDPNRRYQTAATLAEELRHFLASEPILARPAGPWERAVKWTRRRPTAAALLAVIAAALLALISVGVIYQGRLQRSNVQLEAQRDAAERAKSDLEREHQRAQVHLHNALQAVDRLLTHVGSERLAKIPELEETRQQILEDAIGFYRGLLRQEGNDPAVRRQTAWANFYAADLYFVIGKHREGEEHGKEALKVQEQLAADFPERPEYRNDLSRTHVFLSFLYAMSGRFEPSMNALAKAQKLGEELIQHHPENPDFARGLAETYRSLGHAHMWTQPAKAEGYFHQMIRLVGPLATDHPESADYACLLAGGHGYLGMVLFFQNRLEEAEKELRAGLKLLQPPDRAPPRSGTDYRQTLAALQVFLGAVCHRTNRAEEAADLLPKGIAQFEESLKDAPKNFVRRMALAMSYPFLGQLYFRKQEWSLSETAFRTSVDQLDQLAGDFPRFPFFAEMANPPRVLVAILLLRRGEMPPDFAKVLPLADRKNLSGELYYNLACVFALRSGMQTDRKLGEEDCRRAIDLLKQSRAGYLRSAAAIEHARKDEDLKALWGRDDFRALLVELEQTR